MVKLFFHLKKMISKIIYLFIKKDIAEPLFLKNEQVFNCNIMVSFPDQDSLSVPILCMCHKKFIKKGFRCSKCRTLNCKMSTNCVVCKIKLVSATEIVRSSVSLHLEAKFKEVTDFFENSCFSCQEFGALSRQCLSCLNFYCKECCEFIKDDIRFCIGCFEK